MAASSSALSSASSATPTPSHLPPEPGPTPMRFVVLFVYSFGSFVNALVWINFASIANATATLFGVSDFAVNMLSVAFMLLYLPASLVSNFVFESAGLRAGLIWGAGLNAACGVVRYAASWWLGDVGSNPGAFAVLFVGQCFGGLAQPFYTNSPAKIAGTWFPPREREMATTFGSMMNMAGSAVGSVVPSLIVTGVEVSQMRTSLLVSGAIAVGAFLMTLLWVRDKPERPPSASESHREILRTQSLRNLRSGKGLAAAGSGQAPVPGRVDTPLLFSDEEAEEGGPGSVFSDLSPRAAPADDEPHLSSMERLWLEGRFLLTDFEFCKLLFSFSLGIGIFYAFLTLIAQYIQPCGYGSEVSGSIGAILASCGIAGALIVGSIMEKTKAYSLLFKLLSVLSLGGLCFMLSSWRANQRVLLTVSMAVMGATVTPLLPLALENAAEHTYPIPEESGAALLMLGGNTVGVIYLFALQALIPETCENIVNPFSIFLFTSFAVVVLVVATFRGASRRQNAEKNEPPVTSPAPEDTEPLRHPDSRRPSLNFRDPTSRRSLNG